MKRALLIACLSLGLLSPAARAEDANRYEVLVVPETGLAVDKNTQTLLIDRQTGKTWVLVTEFDPTTFAPKDSTWVPLHFKVEPADSSKPFQPPN